MLTLVGETHLPYSSPVFHEIKLFLHKCALEYRCTHVCRGPGVIKPIDDDVTDGQLVKMLSLLR